MESQSALLAEEMSGNPSYDLRDLPAGIDGFFRRSIESPRDSRNPILRDIVGLLTVARKPLALRELSQVMGEKQRTISEQGIRSLRQFLLQLAEGYCFYHARFQDFVERELLYEDEHIDYHRKLAEWPQRSKSCAYDYRLMSLAHHLFESEEHERLRQQVDRAFLAEKFSASATRCSKTWDCWCARSLRLATRRWSRAAPPSSRGCTK